MTTILTNGKIATSEGILKHQNIVIKQDRIVKITSDEANCDEIDFSTADEVIDLAGNLLAPGFIDTQVNGGGNTLFNNETTLEAIRKIGAAHRKYGTTGFLPTLISDSEPVIKQAIKAAQEANRSNIPGFLGLHLEGPFLNRAKKGVHDEKKLCTPNQQSASLLSHLAAIGQSMVTLAPEVVPKHFIKQLAESGIIVSIGHSNASFTQVNAAIKEGAKGFTHLFNAMSALNSREPGAVGAALADKNTWCGLIVDGHHVHPASLNIAIAAKCKGKMMLVSDAIHSVGADGNQFDLAGQTIIRHNGKVTTLNGTLAGSDLDMATAVRNTVNLLGLPLAEALRMASLYPAQFLGIDKDYGTIAPNYKANLVLLNDELQVIDTWINGKQA